ncbi:MAG: hypothetical protein WC718_08910 [Phycisphaerales bacterium]|jgi:hypothetical protein
MPPVLVAIMVIGFVGGVVLLWLGLHGWRINDHPTCRQCRFDLDGVYPESVTCPECGAGLKRENSIRIGVRRRLPALVAIGAVLVLFPAVPLGAVGYAALTGTDINGMLPVGVLLWEAKHATPASGEKIANELLRRAQAKKLSASQYTKAIDAALAMQADPKAPWSEAWGNFIDNARLDGTLSPAGRDAYEQHSASFTLSTRNKTAAGATLPATIKLNEARVASGDAVTHTLTLAGATVDGRKVDAKVASPQGNGVFRMGGGGVTIINGLSMGGGFDNADDGVVGSVMAAGSRVPLGVFGGGASNLSQVEISLPKDLPPGKHTVQLELNQETSAGRIGFGMMPLPTSAGGSPVTLAAEVEIAPVDQLVTPIAPTPEVTAKLARALRPQAITISEAPPRQGGTPEITAQLNFSVAKLPAPVACDVILRSGTHEWKIGELNSGTQAAGAKIGSISTSSFFSVTVNGVTKTSSSSSGDDDRTVEGRAPGFDADSADVILRPRPEAALGTTDQTTYYNEEVVISNVPVQRLQPFDPFGNLRDIQQRHEEMLRRMRSRRP